MSVNNDKILLFYRGFEFVFNSEQELNQAIVKGLEKIYNEALLQNSTYFLNNFTKKDLEYSFKENVIESLKFFSKKEVSSLILARFKKEALGFSSIPKNPKKGFVYLIASSDDCKIGCSQNVEERVKRVSQQNNKKYSIVEIIASDDMYYTEAMNHAIYTPYHLHGEYFNISDNIKLYSIK
jgi:hypothetical protein